MKREDICLVDMNAGQLCGYRPRTSEVKVHIAMMKTAGWNACVHCHPPHCNAFLFAGQVPPNGINPEADIFFNQIPLAPYGTPGTDEVAENVAKMSKKSNVVFMENHGIVCGARDIEEAEWFAENADAYCQVLLLASGHGAKLQQVGPKSVKDFLAIRESLGLPVEKMPFYSESCSSSADRCLSIILTEGNFGRYGKGKYARRKSDSYSQRKSKALRLTSKRLWRKSVIFPWDVLYYLPAWAVESFSRLFKHQ
jgi:L-fuculose-phosphate aldolase